MSGFEYEETEIGLGSGGKFSDPDDAVCAGCGQKIEGEAVWEVGAQWHPGCLPPGLIALDEKQKAVEDDA